MKVIKLNKKEHIKQLKRYIKQLKKDHTEMFWIGFILGGAIIGSILAIVIASIVQ